MATTTKTKRPAKPVDSKSFELGKAKLESSGLTMRDAETLKIHCLTGIQTSQLHPSFKGLCSLRLDYHGPDGQPMEDWPGSDPFYRIRYLEVATDFAGMAEKKPPRYVQ